MDTEIQCLKKEGFCLPGKLAELLGCTSDSGDPEELLNCLRQVDPEVLRAAQASPELQPQEIDTLAWAPTKDRYFMKAEPRM